MLKMDLPIVAQELDTTCGAACFDSMMKHFTHTSLGEFEYASRLKTFELGYTPVENIINLAFDYSLEARLIVDADLEELKSLFSPRQILFVTWWDEDSGHYSLVENISDTNIFLMDPWHARQGCYKELDLKSFCSYWAMRGNKIIVVKDPKFL